MNSSSQICVPVITLSLILCQISIIKMYFKSIQTLENNTLPSQSYIHTGSLTKLLKIFLGFCVTACSALRLTTISSLWYLSQWCWELNEVSEIKSWSTVCKVSNLPAILSLWLKFYKFYSEICNIKKLSKLSI